MFCDFPICYGAGLHQANLVCLRHLLPIMVVKLVPRLFGQDQPLVFLGASVGPNHKSLAMMVTTPRSSLWFIVFALTYSSTLIFLSFDVVCDSERAGAASIPASALPVLCPSFFHLFRLSFFHGSRVGIFIFTARSLSRVVRFLLHGPSWGQVTARFVSNWFVQRRSLMVQQ